MKYLFEVEFTDGTKFYQNKEDKSLTDPKRSSFTDLRHLVEGGKKIKIFTLYNWFNKYSVDLITGIFKINGREFRVEGQYQLPTEGVEYKLVYWRQHQHDFIPGGKELDHRMEFIIGWECDVMIKTTENGVEHTEMKHLKETIKIK